MIALFLWRGAGAAIRGGQVRGRLESVQLSTLLRPIRLARHTDSVAAIAPWLGEATVVVIGADQHPLGIVDPAALAGIPRSDGESASADAVAVRLPDPVSYTHLDVYKRQPSPPRAGLPSGLLR